jgi:hypothetical protein
LEIVDEDIQGSFRSPATKFVARLGNAMHDVFECGGNSAAWSPSTPAELTLARTVVAELLS